MTVSLENIFAIYLIFNIILSVVLILFHARSRQQQKVALNATFLIGWLGGFALLTGFSIGWVISIVGFLIGALSFFSFKDFRPPIAVSTSVCLLLTLSLRGFFVPAYYFIYILLIGASISSIMGMIRYGMDYSDEKFEFASLAFIASIAGLAFFLLPTYPFVARWIAISATVMGLLFSTLLKKYRFKFVEVSIFSLLSFLILYY